MVGEQTLLLPVPFRQADAVTDDEVVLGLRRKRVRGRIVMVEEIINEAPEPLVGGGPPITRWLICALDKARLMRSPVRPEPMMVGCG